MASLGKITRSACMMHGLGYVALTLGLAYWTVRLTLAACGGEFGPPLDDSYIYYQYARSAADGHALQYQPGAEPTRGATSLLYPFLLAPAARWGGLTALPWAGFALGALFLALTAWVADRWAARRVAPHAAWPAGLLTLASGHVLWGWLSGMDIALFGFALTACLAAIPWYQDARTPEEGLRRMGVLAASLGLLSLARPEGMLLALGLGALVPLASRAPNSRRARFALVIPPLLGIALSLGVNLAALGETSSNTLEAKAVWSEQRPDVREGVLRRLPWVLREVARAPFSDFRSPAFHHGSGRVLEALLVTGGILGAIRVVASRSLGLAGWSLLWVVVVGVLSGLIPAGFNSHHHRYQIPFVPAVTLLVLAGWWALPRRIPRAIPLAVVALIGVLLVPGLLRYGQTLANNASNIRDHQVAMGKWIHDNLPEDAIIGLNDAGAIAFYGDRPVVDLVGLVTNGSALPKRAGPGCLFEWLETLDESERPTHLAIFPTWFPYLRKTTLVGPQLVQFVLRRNTISGADLKGLYVANWSSVDRGDHLQERAELVGAWGFTVMDQLDVADLTDERAHGYEVLGTWRSTLREFTYPHAPSSYIIDGGRQPSVGERFTLRCKPGEVAVLVMRTEAFRDFRLQVFANDTEVGLWEVPRLSSQWAEPMFTLPPDVVTSDRVEITLRVPDGDPPYPSFQYWLLQ